jgi:hypothetical protein
MLNRIGTLYVYLDDETVMSWFKARMTGQRGKVEDGKKEYAKLVVADVKEDLSRMGFLGVEIKFNRKAGCSCGCSPGWEIKATGHKKDRAVMHQIMCITPPKDRGQFLVYHFEKGKLSRKAKPLIQFLPRKYKTSQLIGGKWTAVVKRDTYEWKNPYSESALKELGLPGDQIIATTKDYIR